MLLHTILRIPVENGGGILFPVEVGFLVAGGGSNVKQPGKAIQLLPESI